MKRVLAVILAALLPVALLASPVRAGTDTVPPSKPPTPGASSVTTTVANLNWLSATDNVQVTGYHLQQFAGGSWTTVRTVPASGTFQTVNGLSPSTAYTYAVIAFDAAGNNSVRSDPVTFTTLALTALPTCQVQVISFGSGFTVVATITNTTAAPTSGWTIQFTLPLTASVSTAFNGVLTRSGTTGTITPAPWNTVMAPGFRTSPGFQGTGGTPPSGFTLNGVPCTV
ncbi:hypothetical protein Aph01nite_80210 [Acrocarpospora phusangensis]|uniref:Fibronectin type-III domain-containing protein n=1 Tax=Acrocarpospora phusangensis TaxID=1070424 RepID=A0A919QIY4_9ACTN|nr:cellulose binding domain-containing protein [Acrocarpospora phusangensis]GIH29711.1 hypothetical protein Aph01nite_80210 [Acrocarpospora phusangensis]